MQYTSLPHKQDYLLELTNNNYSIETVENYQRDLNFLEAFLWQQQLNFSELDKLTISRYKGFLQKGEHTTTLLELEKQLLATENFSCLKQMGMTQSLVEQKLAQQNTVDSKTDSNNLTKIASPDSHEPHVDSASTRSSTSKIDYKNKQGLSPRSINRMLSSLRNYLKFLIEIDYPKVPLPPDSVKLIKAERKESQVAELDDLLRLIEAPDQLESNLRVRDRNRAMLELLFASGMRISELINLDREQLNVFATSEDDSTGLAGKMYIKGKGKKSRFVYLTDRAKYYLQRYLEHRRDDYPALFIPYRGGRAGTKDPSTVRISTNYLQSKIVEYRRQLGIVVPTSAHSLRHGFATYLAEQGASPAAIQRLLGHESLQTTTRYVHASDKFAEKTHQDYHPASEEN